jgi:hypothetical protein
MSSIPNRLARFLCKGTPCDKHAQIAVEVYKEIVSIQQAEREAEAIKALDRLAAAREAK